LDLDEEGDDLRVIRSPLRLHGDESLESDNENTDSGIYSREML
jgi:hypothetical protein